MHSEEGCYYSSPWLKHTEFGNMSFMWYVSFLFSETETIYGAKADHIKCLPTVEVEEYDKLTFASKGMVTKSLPICPFLKNVMFKDIVSYGDEDNEIEGAFYINGFLDGLMTKDEFSLSSNTKFDSLPIGSNFKVTNCEFMISSQFELQKKSVVTMVILACDGAEMDNSRIKLGKGRNV